LLSVDVDGYRTSGATVALGAAHPDRCVLVCGFPQDAGQLGEITNRHSG
jgi:hypothetical protein